MSAFHGTRARPTVVHGAREGAKFSADTTLKVMSCPTCHITYAIPASLERAALHWRGSQSNGWRLCCPLGHTWWYTGENEEDRLRGQLVGERERRARLAAERDQLQASERAQRGAATRARNERDRVRTRAAAGVCPCCNRTFQNVARHVASQHPDFPS